MNEEYDFAEPTDDFGNLTLEELRAVKTSPAELKSIRRGALAKWLPIQGYSLADCFYFLVGMSNNHRFFVLALNFDADSNKFVYHQVKLADEQEIKRLWCG